MQQRRINAYKKRTKNELKKFKSYYEECDALIVQSAAKKRREIQAKISNLKAIAAEEKKLEILQIEAEKQHLERQEIARQFQFQENANNLTRYIKKNQYFEDNFALHDAVEVEMRSSNGNTYLTQVQHLLTFLSRLERTLPGILTALQKGKSPPNLYDNLFPVVFAISSFSSVDIKKHLKNLTQKKNPILFLNEVESQGHYRYGTFRLLFLIGARGTQVGKKLFEQYMNALNMVLVMPPSTRAPSLRLKNIDVGRNAMQKAAKSDAHLKNLPFYVKNKMHKLLTFVYVLQQKYAIQKPKYRIKSLCKLIFACKNVYVIDIANDFVLRFREQYKTDELTLYSLQFILYSLEISYKKEILTFFRKLKTHKTYANTFNPLKPYKNVATFLKNELCTKGVTNQWHKHFRYALVSGPVELHLYNAVLKYFGQTLFERDTWRINEQLVDELLYTVVYGSMFAERTDDIYSASALRRSMHMYMLATGEKNILKAFCRRFRFNAIVANEETKKETITCFHDALSCETDVLKIIRESKTPKNGNPFLSVSLIFLKLVKGCYFVCVPNADSEIISMTTTFQQNILQVTPSAMDRLSTLLGYAGTYLQKNTDKIPAPSLPFL